MYVAVKGGEKAIAAAHALLARERRGDVQIPEVTLEQLAGQLKLAVDRIMAEGSLYSPELAALAFKQAQGDAVEAIFLLRAYRTTLPRFGVSEPMDTSRMRVERRISAPGRICPADRSWDPPLTIRTACWIAVWPCPGQLPGTWSPKGRRKIWR